MNDNDEMANFVSVLVHDVHAATKLILLSDIAQTMERVATRMASAGGSCEAAALTTVASQMTQAHDALVSNIPAKNMPGVLKVVEILRAMYADKEKA